MWDTTNIKDDMIDLLQSLKNSKENYCSLCVNNIQCQNARLTTYLAETKTKNTMVVLSAPIAFCSDFEKKNNVNVKVNNE